MDAEQFDRWTQDFDGRIARRGLGGIVLAVLSSTTIVAESPAKRKKKKKKKKPTPPVPCAAHCADWCCTGEFGQCIRPAQQGGARCGHGGERCAPCGSDACRPLGGVCVVDAECCDDGVNLLECQDQHCCKPAGQPCTTTQGCCPQLQCSRGPSLESELKCRGTWGALCHDYTECMDGRNCQRGRCCAPLNMPCELDEHCCESTYLCRVVDVFGPDKVCCLPPGAFCIQEGENQACCSGHCTASQQCS